MANTPLASLKFPGLPDTYTIPKNNELVNEGVKTALLQLAQKVAYIDEDGQDYYDDLYNALYPAVGVNNIIAVFNSGGVTIYDTNTLDDLRQYLTVTAVMTDSSTEVVTTYTLSGSMDAGTQTITVAYGGKTTTFTVTVAEWVTSTTAVFTQGSATIYDTDSLDTLKQYLVVTATYADSTTATVTDYTLSGTLTAGTSTITVSYGGKTDTFSVAVNSTALPTGYTKYDYIQKKNTTSESKAKANFIILNDQPDMNVLSLEMLVAKKSGVYHSGGFLGVRNESGWLTSYSVYGTAKAGEYEGVSGYGIQIALRGVHITGEHELTETPSKIEIINPSTSPITLKANGSVIATLPWETTFSIPHGMWLFGNGPYNTTSNVTMNSAARIGHIILRKNTGECAGYYIPCVYDGKIGVYDLVSEAFYTASTASVVTISNSGCLYSVGNWS